MLHAVPDSPQVDRDDTVEFLAAGISSVDRRTLHAGIVERSIQPSKGIHGLFDHRRDFVFVRDVTAHGQHPMPSGGELVCCGTRGAGIHVREHDRGSRLGERLGSHQAHAGCRTGYQGDSIYKRLVYECAHLLTSCGSNEYLWKRRQVIAWLLVELVGVVLDIGLVNLLGPFARTDLVESYRHGLCAVTQHLRHIFDDGFGELGLLALGFSGPELYNDMRHDLLLWVSALLSSAFLTRRSALPGIARQPLFPT